MKGGEKMKKVAVTTIATLIISTYLTFGQAEAATNGYTVKSGDTMYTISKMYGVSVSKMASLNPQVGNINYLYVGQKLNTPTASWEQKADSIIEFGKQYIGVPYVYGAKRLDPASGFDCSAFTQWIFYNFGIKLNATSQTQAVQGVDVPFSEIRKGDLLFFTNSSHKYNTGIDKVGHVGVYLGNGKVLQTYKVGVGVTISDLYNDPRTGNYFYRSFLFAKRVI